MPALAPVPAAVMYTANDHGFGYWSFGNEFTIFIFQPGIEWGQTKRMCSSRAAIKILLEKYRQGYHDKERLFENAITVIMVLGGSTNAVLHLITIAKECGSKTDAGWFPGNKRPHSGAGWFQTIRQIPDGRPTQTWWCSCSDEIFMEEWVANGDCLTVTGKTVAEKSCGCTWPWFYGTTNNKPLEKPVEENRSPANTLR